MKMMISQEQLVDIDPALCQNASCMKPFCIFGSPEPKAPGELTV